MSEQAQPSSISVGNIDDDLGQVAECDWIVEVVLERLDIKQSLYKKPRRGAEARHAGLVEHVDDPRWHMLDRRHARRASSEGLPDHPFLQPAALTCGFSKSSRGRSRDPAMVETVSRFCRRGDGQEHRRSARTAPVSSPTVSASTGCSAVSWKRWTAACRWRRQTAVMGRPLGIPKTGIFGLHRPRRHRSRPAYQCQPRRRCCRRPTPSIAVNRDIPLIGQA